MERVRFQLAWRRLVAEQHNGILAVIARNGRELVEEPAALGPGSLLVALANLVRILAASFCFHGRPFAGPDRLW